MYSIFYVFENCIFKNNFLILNIFILSNCVHILMQTCHAGQDIELM